MQKLEALILILELRARKPKYGTFADQYINSIASTRDTVRLLTHVLCKPTHFFFHSSIATMSYSLPTSFNSLIKDWADKYHVWGTPRGRLQGQTRDNSNTRFFTHKGTHRHVFLYNICR